MAGGYRHIMIVERGLLKQKYHAQFVADNGEVLSWTENYKNLSDLMDMLEKYFPDWPIEMDS